MENKTEIENLKDQRQQMRKNKANYDDDSSTADELQKQIDNNLIRQKQKEIEKLKKKDELKKEISEMLSEYVEMKNKIFGISQRQASSSLNKSSSYISMCRKTTSQYLPKYQFLDIIDDEIKQINENINYLISSSLLDKNKTKEKLRNLSRKIQEIKSNYVKYLLF